MIEVSGKEDFDIISASIFVVNGFWLVREEMH